MPSRSVGTGVEPSNFTRCLHLDSKPEASTRAEGKKILLEEVKGRARKEE
jgi:hypothetical protein